MSSCMNAIVAAKNRVIPPMTHDQVHAGRDHRCGVDQRRDRSGPFHGVREPGVEWELGALGRDPDEQKEGDRLRGPGPASELAVGAREHLAVVERPQLADQQEGGEDHPDVADDVDDKGLLGGRHGARAVVVVANQQIARQSDEAPSDDEKEEVPRHHEQQHREDEEVHLGEEAPVVAVRLHVVRREKQDQRADTRDHEHHVDRQGVHLDRQVDRQPADVDPLPQRGDLDSLVVRAREVDREDGHRDDECGGDRRHGQRPREFARRLLGRREQDQEREERQSENDPGQDVHDRRPSPSSET
jgi:hypothetical protein